MFIINNSPLTKYHLLVIPDVKSNQPQVMTLKCLELGLRLISCCDDRAIRFGYNSPGALASVNHLHLHMLHVERELFVEFVELRQLIGNFYLINDKRLPTRGFCLLLSNIDVDSKKLYKLVEFCCQMTIPHNMFFTKSRTSDETRIFFFPRTKKAFGEDKIYSSFLNVAFCELAGYIPIGDEKLFQTINENYILERFNEEVQDICDVIENDFVRLLSEFES
jgi:GDP-D-glucose phosphorylase